MVNKPKILYYDLETTPLQAWVWGCGKQVVRHTQLVNNYDTHGIICATYCWNDGKPAKSIDWGYKEQSTKTLVEKFDEIIKQADWVIGKNSNRFDNKMLNAARILNNLSPLPDWMKYTDDLEVQMRRHFRLPSHSLDYISKQLGLGGKIKMQFEDWIDIVEKNPERGLAAFNKMIKYGKKDVEDTRYLWEYMSTHFDSTRLNMGGFSRERHGCRHCGNGNTRKDGTRIQGLKMYQTYFCNDCGMYAGRSLINSKSGLLSNT